MRLNQPTGFADFDGPADDIERFRAALNQGALQMEPFAHMVVTSPFREAYVQALLAEYPSEDGMGQVSGRIPGRRYSDRRLSRILPQPDDDEIAGLPASQRQLSRILRAPHVVNHLVRVFPNRTRENLLRAARALETDTLNVKVSIELIHDRSGFELRPHTDGGIKLVTGLVYLAEPGDPESLGTRIYRPKDPEFADSGNGSFSTDEMDEVATIPYRRNTMLLFARTNRSFHGVAADSSGVARRLIQFSVMLDIPPEVAAELKRRRQSA